MWHLNYEMGWPLVFFFQDVVSFLFTLPLQMSAMKEFFYSSVVMIRHKSMHFKLWIREPWGGRGGGCKNWKRISISNCNMFWILFIVIIIFLYIYICCNVSDYISDIYIRAVNYIRSFIWHIILTILAKQRENCLHRSQQRFLRFHEKIYEWYLCYEL